MRIAGYDSGQCQEEPHLPWFTADDESAPSEISGCQAMRVNFHLRLCLVSPPTEGLPPGHSVGLSTPLLPKAASLHCSSSWKDNSGLTAGQNNYARFGVRMKPPRTIVIKCRQYLHWLILRGHTNRLHCTYKRTLPLRLHRPSSTRR